MLITKYPQKLTKECGTADLSAAITQTASKQTYYTIRFLMDRDRVKDAYRAYAYFRPSNRHPRYRNLYFVGASTHPGTGIPTAMVSCRLVAKGILDELEGLE